MGTEIRTTRIRRTFLDRISLWKRAYETKVFDARHQSVGRGPTPEASEEAALRQWVTDVELQKQ